MKLEGLFKKTPVRLEAELPSEEDIPKIPDGLWAKCPKCKQRILQPQVSEHYYQCPKCNTCLRMPATERIRLLTEENTFEEWDTGLSSRNPLRMKNYPDRIAALKESTGLDEAVVTGHAKIGKYESVLIVMDASFLTASMGEVVGEKITRAFEKAIIQKLPVIMFCCSGGARMQEGIISLMQMAKTSDALRRHSEAGLLCISVLTDPTMGGVTASFASLADIILAEPGALIGFAGPRVIEQTIHQKLPEGFQRAEYLLEHGFVDAVIPREDMKQTLEQLLAYHSTSTDATVFDMAEAQKRRIRPAYLETVHTDMSKQGNNSIGSFIPRRKLTEEQKLRSTSLTAWERVELAREKARLRADDYIRSLFDSFTELHGDRCFGDDPAIIGGIAMLNNTPITVIAQQKGHGTKDSIRCNFGMPRPEGYRKAIRLMKQAEKFHRPVVCIVDTPGAFCGKEAEERGQGQAIAECISTMAGLKTKTLSLFIGEGGSGGALALGVADQILILENAVYSILSPEGFASILWKDASQAKQAAKVMRMTAYDIYQYGIADTIIPEPVDFEALHHTIQTELA